MAEHKVNANINLLGGGKVLGALPGSAIGEYVTYEQLQATVEGLPSKDDVRVASAANLNLASPGASIDSVAMISGDRFLAFGQTAAAENGIYIWNGAAVAATRAPDASTGAELLNALVPVNEGALNGQKVFRQTAVNITLGTTPVTFIQFGVAAGAASETSSGVAEIATQAETDTGTDDLRMVTPLKLKTWTGAPKKYSALFGDGTATQYDITHNLNTTQLTAEVFIASSGETVGCQITRTNANTVRVNVNTAPAVNAYRIVIGD